MKSYETFLLLIGSEERDKLRRTLDQMDKCPEIAWGGPGHQSKRTCCIRGTHKEHRDDVTGDEWTSTGRKVYIP